MATGFDRVFDFLGGGDAPKPPDMVQLDPRARELLDQGVARASRSGAEHQDEENAGIDAYAGGLLGGGGDQEAASSAQNPYYVQGLRDAYKSQARSGIDAVKNQNQFSAEMRRSDQLKRMQMAAMGQQQAQLQNYQMLTQAYNQNEAARAQFISSIFGVARTGIGMGMASKGPSAPQFEMGTQANLLDQLDARTRTV